MAQRDDWAWRPESVLDEASSADGSWSYGLSEDRTPPRWSSLRLWLDWRNLDALRLGVLLVAASLVLIGTGAVLALSLAGGSSGARAGRAGLEAVSPPGGVLSAAETRAIAREVDPAVVNINAVIETPSGAADVAGTGMILSANGDIVTNNHVIENAKTIRVTVHGGRQHFLATFLGADPRDDVALLKVSASHPLPTVRLGTSRLLVGSAVLAFGNSLGLGGVASVTSGAVSALNRSITATSETGADTEHLNGMIETDAPIAPGNSGGPLVDANGLVVGMNTAAASGVGAAGSPVAFALPIGRIMTIVRQIESGSRGDGIVIGRSAYLGIEGTSTRTPGTTPRGAVSIVQVEPATPASSAGLQPGDVITSFAGHKVTSMPALSHLIGSLRPGDRVKIVFESAGNRRAVVVRLAAGPAA
jgi:S1-C subfamily serine protease